MPKHIIRLIALLITFGTLAFAAKSYFVPESYWKYGHFRAESVTEIAGNDPIYKGSRSCASCHSAQSHEWSVSNHLIACEDCHGPAGRHPLTSEPPLPADAGTHASMMHARYDAATGKMHIPANTVQLCSQCHEAVAGRRPTQPQIVVSLHAGSQQCAACHAPHSPKIVFPSSPDSAQSGAAGSGKKASAQCAACHGAEGRSVSPDWPNLAGQRRAYLAAALEAYRTGKRNAPIMNGIAATLSEADIGNLAAYFSGLTWQTAISTRPASNADTGKAKAEACAACHGIASNPIIPNIAGQNEMYLADAIKAYRTGARRSSLMNRVASHLTGSDIKWLTAYYARENAASATGEFGASP